ncbi:hypothetical protein PM082_006445 [Marasmius tenuissimus]|nr:hypothetical protein PM082_006445 [Marasmius tenuissimus]
MSDFLRNAREFTITGGNFSHVEGDQHTHHHHHSTTQIIRKGKRKRTEYDDVHIVKSSAICRIRDVHVDRYRDRWWRKHPRKVDKTICVAQVNRGSSRAGTVCTVVSYTGPDAQNAFKKDFRKHLELAVSAKAVQIYAVDIGRIPSLIFWNELVPAVVLKENVGWLGEMYLHNLRAQWECREEELWMDPVRGMICRGPVGPYPDLPGGWLLNIGDMPSTADTLQEDVFLRFLASCQSKEVDHAFFTGLTSAWHNELVPEPVDQSAVISALHRTPIAVANNVWKSYKESLVEEKVLDNELTRFRVSDRDGVLSLGLNYDVRSAWLCQALKIFHARGISLNDDLSVYEIIYRPAWLDGYLSDNQVLSERRSAQSIYLFLRRPPRNLSNGWRSSLHFWSFHEDGGKPLSTEICNHLGLPIEFLFSGQSYYSFSWSTKGYRQIDQYQRLRSFDPTTAAISRHLGYGPYAFQPSTTQTVSMKYMRSGDVLNVPSPFSIQISA